MAVRPHQDIIVTLDAGGSAIDAGWFPDPAGSPWLRWWDGANWTDHFIDPATGAPPQDAAPSAPTAPAVASTGAALTRRELRDQQSGLSAGQPTGLSTGLSTGQPTGLNTDVHAATAPMAVVANFDQQPPVPTQAGVPDFSSSPANEPLDTTAVAPGAAPSPFDDLLRAQSSAAGQPFAPSAPVASATPVAPFASGAPIAPFAPTLDAPFGQSWATAPAPKMEDAYFPPREQQYVPMVNARAELPQAAQEVAAGSVSTVPIWLYAVLPVLHAAVAWFVVERLKLTDLGALRWAIIAGPIVIYLILAAVDRRVLQSRGHVYLASALLGIIPPLYIGIRAARLGARAVPPAIVWLLLQAAGIAVLLLLFPAVVTQLTAADIASGPTIQPQPTPATHVLTAAERANLLTPAGMAAELKTEFASKGVALTSVTCPQLASTTDGTQVTCTGTLPVSTLDILVSVDNVNALAAFDIISSVPHQS